MCLTMVYLIQKSSREGKFIQYLPLSLNAQSGSLLKKTCHDCDSMLASFTEQQHFFNVFREL